MKLCHEHGVKVMYTRYLVATAGTCTCFVILVADDYQWKVYWKPFEWASTVGRDWLLYDCTEFTCFYLWWRSFGGNPWHCFPRIIDYCFLWDRGGFKRWGFPGWIRRMNPVSNLSLMFSSNKPKPFFFASTAVILQVEHPWITLSKAAKSVYIFTYYWEELYNLELSHVQNALILYLPNWGGKPPTSRKASAVSQQTSFPSGCQAPLWTAGGHPPKRCYDSNWVMKTARVPCPHWCAGVIGHLPLGSHWFGDVWIGFSPRPRKTSDKQGYHLQGWKNPVTHVSGHIEGFLCR